MPTMNIGIVRPLPVAALVLAASLAAGGAFAAPLSVAGTIRADGRAPLVRVQLFGQQRSNDSELVARLGQLENQIRQLTGMIEELQHRNNQLEQQLKRVQQDTDFRFQEMKPSGGRAPAPGQRSQSDAIPPPPPGMPSVASRQAPPAASRQTPQVALPPEQSAPPSGRRGDVFDPSTAPNAPGVPRTLGTIPSGSAPGGPDGRPLDLGSLAVPGQGGQGGQGLPPASSGGFPQAGSPVGPQAVLAPSDSPKDQYDLAYGAVLRRDYELAVEGFRVFLANHGGNREPDAQRLMPDAHYWLGESQFQLKQYNDAAETFLKISTDYPNAVRAPEALLRLGQSLAALGERETACASLGHVLTKYPKASENVKRAVEQEQKRVRC